MQPARQVHPRLQFLLNCSLEGATPAYAAMNHIFLQARNGQRYKLWLYGTDWAIVSKKKEIAARDYPEADKVFDLSKYYGSKIIDIYEFDDGTEIHIEFENQLCLEIDGSGLDGEKKDHIFFIVFDVTGKSKSILSYPFHEAALSE